MEGVGTAEGIGEPVGRVAVLQVTCHVEVSGYLVGSTAFKAAGTGDPRPAGSIPVHLRQSKWDGGVRPHRPN